MKYKLETTKVFGGKRSLRAGIKRFAPLIVPERGRQVPGFVFGKECQGQIL